MEEFECYKYEGSKDADDKEPVQPIEIDTTHEIYIFPVDGPGRVYRKRGSKFIFVGYTDKKYEE